jgi:hypothetical protein
MTLPDNDDWSISIFVPDPDMVAPLASDDAVENQSLRDFIPGLNRVVKVGADKVQEQWSRTVNTLMELSATIGTGSKEWEIDEVEVGLTLSAKGELLFIAEAGAEASIKFLLKKKKPGATGSSSTT